MPTQAGSKYLFIHFLYIVWAVFIFRRKMNVPNQSEIKIKIIIPALTCCLRIKKQPKKFPYLEIMNNYKSIIKLMELILKNKY